MRCEDLSRVAETGPRARNGFLNVCEWVLQRLANLNAIIVCALEPWQVCKHLLDVSQLVVKRQRPETEPILFAN